MKNYIAMLGAAVLMYPATLLCQGLNDKTSIETGIRYELNEFAPEIQIYLDDIRNDGILDRVIIIGPEGRKELQNGDPGFRYFANIVRENYLYRLLKNPKIRDLEINYEVDWDENGEKLLSIEIISKSNKIKIKIKPGDIGFKYMEKYYKSGRENCKKER